MPSYTPEQIEQAKEWMRYQIKWHKPGSSPAIHYTVILAALEAAQKERDNAERARDDADIYAKAYAAKLEKAGDAMYGCSAVDFDKACVAWEAARKEKP